jgi:hypothetical protein
MAAVIDSCITANADDSGRELSIEAEAKGRAARHDPLSRHHEGRSRAIQLALTENTNDPRSVLVS